MPELNPRRVVDKRTWIWKVIIAWAVICSFTANAISTRVREIVFKCICPQHGFDWIPALVISQKKALWKEVQLSHFTFQFQQGYHVSVHPSFCILTSSGRAHMFTLKYAVIDSHLLAKTSLPLLSLGPQWEFSSGEVLYKSYGNHMGNMNHHRRFLIHFIRPQNWATHVA